MNIRIESNFEYAVASMCYMSDGELHIVLSKEGESSDSHYVYTASLGNGIAEECPKTSLLEYARNYFQTSRLKDQTKDSYRLMCRHLERYGDVPIESITTGYLQDFIVYLQAQGLKTGTVRLYFQKLACVLHDAYKNELFDERILKRVNRPKKEQEKKCFLTEAELKRLPRHQLPAEYANIQAMFLFSRMTGLRFSDIQGLCWDNVKRTGKHLSLEFRQQKTGTLERLPLCEEAEGLLRGIGRNGKKVFSKETNQRANAAIKRWLKIAGIKKPVTFHCARHTFCVMLLTKDVPIYTVQQLMCHADIGTTKVYADLPNRSKSKAIKRLPKIMEAKKLCMNQAISASS